MAVVVQRMVGARSSGVMFTRSPLSGDKSVVAIDASWGLGSAVVSGDVTPDSFVVSKVTGDVKRNVAVKTRWHRPDPSGHGVVETDVPADLQARPSVSDAEIAELVAIARTVEAHYGCPQDIEWAIAEDGGVFLLQSRPETVWAVKDAERDAARKAAPAARPFDHVFNLLGGKRPSDG
jgi:pyruvate,water dikinase